MPQGIVAGRPAEARWKRAVRPSFHRVRPLGLVLCLWSGAAAEAAPTHEEVRAALVYKFAQFVQWNAEPAASDSPLVVGLLGDDRIRPALEAALLGKRLHGQSLEVRTFNRPEDVRHCDVLLVDVPESRRELALKKLPAQGLLTIGEGPSFARQGGVIALLLDGPRVEFDLNLAAAERAGVTIDAGLLGLARQAGRW